MPVRINNPVNTYKLNTNIETYQIVPDITIKRGDLLSFTEIDGVVCVTNIIDSNNMINAIALNSSSDSTTSIRCYKINEYSRKCSDISNCTGSLLSSMTCDEINAYGVRINQVNIN